MLQVFFCLLQINLYSINRSDLTEPAADSASNSEKQIGSAPELFEDAFDF
jgi:hypothetical protein